MMTEGRFLFGIFGLLKVAIFIEMLQNSIGIVWFYVADFVIQ